MYLNTVLEERNLVTIQHCFEPKTILFFFLQGRQTKYKTETVTVGTIKHCFLMFVCVNTWNRDGICKIGHMRVDHVSIEILCTDLRDVWANFVGVT